MATTWNPSDKSTNLTLSNGDSTMTSVAYADSLARATEGKSTGKWYFEITCVSGDYFQAGGFALSSESVDETLGASSTGWGCSGGYKYNGSAVSTDGAQLNNGSVLGVAVDLDNGKIWFANDNVWVDSGDPGAGTNATFSNVSGTVYPANSSSYGSIVSTVNFGATSFAYTAPSGFTGYDAPTNNLEVDDPVPTLLAEVSVMGSIVVTTDPIDTLLSLGEGAFLSTISSDDPAAIILAQSGEVATFDDIVETMSSYGGASLTVDDPMSVILATGAISNIGTLEISSPVEGISAFPGGITELIEPTLSISATGKIWGLGLLEQPDVCETMQAFSGGSLEADAPVGTISATGYSTDSGTLEVDDPVSTISATGYLQNFGTLEVASPVNRISATGFTDGTGQLEVNDPLPTLSATGYSWNYGSLEVDAPMDTISSIAFNEIHGELEVTESLMDIIYATGEQTTSNRMDDEILRHSRC